MKEQDEESEYYDEREVMSRQEREKYYNSRLREQIQYAYENAPAMKAKLDKAGVKPSDIRTVRIWRRYQSPPKTSLLICGRKILHLADC